MVLYSRKQKKQLFPNDVRGSFYKLSERTPSEKFIL